MFESFCTSTKKFLKIHHEVYSSPCKDKYWEELCSKALIESGFGSDWIPDSNHKVGIDQTTNSKFKIKISNKSGQISEDKKSVKISGSRSTKYESLDEKIQFFSSKNVDYIFCLSTQKNWIKNFKKYYLIMIDTNNLDYHNQQWEKVYYVEGPKNGKLKGYKCESENYSAEITNSLSDQLWTKVNYPLFSEFYELVID